MKWHDITMQYNSIQYNNIHIQYVYSVNTRTCISIYIHINFHQTEQDWTMLTWFVHLWICAQRLGAHPCVHSSLVLPSFIKDEDCCISNVYICESSKHIETIISYILVAANYVPLLSPIMYYRFWYSNCCWCMQLSIDHDVPSVLYFLRIFLTLITIIYCFPKVISYDYERFLINSYNIVIIIPPTYLSWGPQSLCFWSSYDISHHDIADQAAWWWFA